MGRGDNRRTRKMVRHTARNKKKTRLKNRAQRVRELRKTKSSVKSTNIVQSTDQTSSSAAIRRSGE